MAEVGAVTDDITFGGIVRDMETRTEGEKR
jgi:hypothetical protein